MTTARGEGAGGAHSSQRSPIRMHILLPDDDSRARTLARKKITQELIEDVRDNNSRDTRIKMDSGILAPIVITTIDAKAIGDKCEFSKNIPGKETDTEALFLKGIRVAREEDGVKIFEGTLVADAKEFQKLIHDVAQKNGADQILLYVHGFTVTPSGILEDTAKMNAYYASLAGPKAFVIPVIWPSEPLDYSGQKDIAPCAAAALRSLLPKFSRTMPVSIVCHSMGNFVLKKFAPVSGDPIFKFTNIYMVASDVHQTTFDQGDSVEEGDFEGDDILRLVQGEEDEGKFTSKVHVLWYWWDMALLGRRFLNQGRPALGKNGFDKSKVKPENRPKIVQRECTDFAKTIEGAHGYYLGHGYHTTPGALDYYLVDPAYTPSWIHLQAAPCCDFSN
eukprot:CAMPEP_0171649734 /NCGR_PEP_ID=MMETSP0990-20121206/37061_1 /TAXON_ID=483369 /ORGANISM="non described non described, Strain CCMP2098" /LENGTH=390 /DNA_ID=CAMNT_0012227871 /DNA_START=416 /DNA_END=1590 /DNA_ORIENTATION=-